jgi:RHS repeat-associated protein
MRYQGSGFAGANATKQCSGAGTSYSYDALGRMTSSTNADGTTSWQYNGRAVETTDVNNVQKITQYDVLGRISAICEISSNASMPGSGSPVACGMDIAGTGFLTNYSYDLADHKTTITQGAQTRVFQTDAAGRTIYTSEPERGVTTYSYSYNGTGLRVTRTRPQANQTNPSVLTTTTTQYDSLGRVVDISYNDSTTPEKVLVYDAPCCWPNTSSPTHVKGRLSTIGSASSGALFSYDIMGNVNQIWQCTPSTCGTGTQLTRTLSFAYDLAGNLTMESDPVSGAISYGRSPAGEITSITNQTYTDPTNTPNLVSNVVNGPNGPISYTLGNGLNVFQTYDAMGRKNGNWVCLGPAQFGCGGGTQIYGTDGNMRGNQVLGLADTILNQAFNYGYDEFNRLATTNDHVSGQQLFSYVYDRYGNRTAQNAPQGGPAPSYAVNTANNQIMSFSYDAAGNLTSDGIHSYTYDAEGNVLLVDGGAQQFVYDALNRRIRMQGNGYVNEYVYDYAGRRISTWNPSTNSGIEGRIYWGGALAAFRAIDGTTYFDHQDWLGAERLRTNYAGTAVSTYASLPWGDGFAANLPGNDGDQDQQHFALLEHDTESNTEHAQFRQYSSTQGRWMSPDPYDGSYDAGNPQSMNRYSYVLNNPLAFIDPQGRCTTTNVLDNDGNVIQTMTVGDDCGGYSYLIYLGGFGPSGSSSDSGAGGNIGGTQTITPYSPPKAPNNGTPTVSHCLAVAAADKGVSIALDALGSIPAVGNAVSATAGIVRAGIAVNHAITSPAFAVGSGLYGAYGGVTAGPEEATDSLVGSGSAGAGIGLALADASLEGTKAIPLVGNAVSLLTLGWDGYQAYQKYQSCMAGH